MENKVRKTTNTVSTKAGSAVKKLPRIKMQELKNTGSMKAVNGARGFFISLKPTGC